MEFVEKLWLSLKLGCAGSSVISSRGGWPYMWPEESGCLPPHSRCFPTRKCAAERRGGTRTLLGSRARRDVLASSWVVAKPSSGDVSGHGRRLLPLCDPRVPQESRDLAVAFQPSGLVRLRDTLPTLWKLSNSRAWVRARAPATQSEISVKIPHVAPKKATGIVKYERERPLYISSSFRTALAVITT